jgi:hypothetical protein
MCGEKRQELGRPDGFLHLAGTSGYPLSDWVQVGGFERPSREAEDPSGVGSAHSVRRDLRVMSFAPGAGCASRKPDPNMSAVEESSRVVRREPDGLRFAAMSLLRHKPGIRWLLARHRNPIATSELNGNLAESA